MHGTHVAPFACMRAHGFDSFAADSSRPVSGEQPRTAAETCLAEHVGAGAIPSDIAAAMAGHPYRLLRLLGRGGTADVYEAQNGLTGARCAVKLLRHASAASPTELARFWNEARLGALLDGEQHVRVIDAGMRDDEHATPFLAMELLEGETLETAAPEPMAPADVLAIMEQLAQGVERLHALGIVHCDLKPDNVFICRDGAGRSRLKLLDLGVAQSARRERSDELLDPPSMFGTPGYMAPEQAQAREQAIDARADVWALGLIAYRLLSGRAYFEVEAVSRMVLRLLFDPMAAPSELGCEVSPAFDSWFLRSCSKEPHQRFDSARAQLDELRALLAEVSEVRVTVEPRERTSIVDSIHEEPRPSASPQSERSTARSHLTARSPANASVKPRRARPETLPTLAAADHDLRVPLLDRVRADPLGWLGGAAIARMACGAP